MDGYTYKIILNIDMTKGFYTNRFPNIIDNNEFVRYQEKIQ